MSDQARAVSIVFVINRITGPAGHRLTIIDGGGRTITSYVVHLDRAAASRAMLDAIQSLIYDARRLDES